MALLKAFISSTCYDLGLVRSKLEEFFRSLGHEPILSEHSDVLFDPRVHTHTSCIDEVPNCDLMVLLIGSRYGGKAVPEAIARIDLDKLAKSSRGSWASEKGQQFSITQLEVLRGLEARIPLFVFVEDRVHHDHLVYEKNKGSEIIDQLRFPSIEHPETARYIFEFINFLRLRNAGNAIAQFRRIEDIEEHLRKQMSALLQRLLAEQRIGAVAADRAQSIQAQLDELRTAILSSIQAPDARAVAKGVLRYRFLIEFAISLSASNALLLVGEGLSWSALMASVNVARLTQIIRPRSTRTRRFVGVFLTLADGSCVEVRASLGQLRELPDEISDFVREKLQTREAIVAAWQENFVGQRLVRDQDSDVLSLLPTRLDEPFRLEHYDTDFAPLPNVDLARDGGDYDDVPF